MIRGTVIALALLCGLCATGGPLCADELTDLLSGFDEENPETQAADDPGPLDDLLGGFDEEPTETVEAQQESASSLPDWLLLKGGASLFSTVNFKHDAPQPGQPDYRGLSMFQARGELIADAAFGDWRARLGGTAFYDAAYHLNDQRGYYSDAYLDEYEHEVELGEAYLHGPLGKNLDLKIGRQIVVWGKSDNIRVTDVLNPLDRRYPGLLDIRYLRLPVTMTKLDYFTGDWSVSPILIHEPRFDKYTVYNGEFFPADTPFPPAAEPGWSWDNQQYALAANGTFSGWDLSFYAASVYQEQPYIDFRQTGSPVLRREKAAMIGSAVNIALGNWLVKGEAAWWNGLRYSNTLDEKSRLDVLAGVEYSGFDETTISFEVANRHIFDFEPWLESGPDYQQEDQAHSALRFVRDFRNETVRLTVLLLSNGLFFEDGGFQRIQLEYDLSDDITLLGGVVFYKSGDYPGFADIGSNDRVLFESEYRF